MTAPRACDGCAVKRVATKKHRFCFDCEPGGPFPEPPCRRCGASNDYYSAGLCGRCHHSAPQPPESCLDCYAWGVRRLNGWLCKSCLGWRPNNPLIAACRVCGTERHINADRACRLCWRHAIASKAPRDPLELMHRNRHGQQLFLANVGRISMIAPTTPAPRPVKINRRIHQLDLFAPPSTWLRRHGYREPPDPAIADRLDAVCVGHAVSHGWSRTTTDRTRRSLRAVLGMLQHRHGPITVSAATECCATGDWPAKPVLAILAEADLLTDDRVPAVATWFDRQIVGLAPLMVDELRVWFDVLHNGSTIAPRTRPRHQVTIRTRTTWAMPVLREWTRAGRLSLREISRADVLAALPASGNDRATTAIALRSIFKTLKGRKIIFVNPAVRLDAGEPASREPLPLAVDDLRNILESDSPACAALGALVIFHGLAQQDLRALTLTDVHDGRLHLNGRTILLAAPVRDRVARWLDHRNQRWPNTANPHLFLSYRSAITLEPVGRRWVRLTLGVSVRSIREDRILNEAHASDGDVRRLVDLFGLSITAASRYTRTVDHPDLMDLDRPEP